MPRISEHFQLPTPVPFVDVRVEQDNRLFVEPSAIRAAAADGDTYAVAAQHNLTSFTGQLLGTVHSGDEAAGTALLKHLHEPNETRLGMTGTGVAGHGIGAGIAQDLWAEMHANPACQDAMIVKRLEDLAVYVNRVGPDLVSDMATRITFDVLADFTADMMATYPTMAADASTEREWIWDTATAAWTTRDVTLPVAGGTRLLLVPTSWVWLRQLLNAPSFYQVQALGRIQDRFTVPAQRQGDRPVAPTKDSLKRAYTAVRPTNISEAVAAAAEGVDLTERHALHTQARYEELRRASDEINKLIQAEGS